MNFSRNAGACVRVRACLCGWLVDWLIDLLDCYFSHVFFSLFFLSVSTWIDWGRTCTVVAIGKHLTLENVCRLFVIAPDKLVGWSISNYNTRCIHLSAAVLRENDLIVVVELGEVCLLQKRLLQSFSDMQIFNLPTHTPLSPPHTPPVSTYTVVDEHTCSFDKKLHKMWHELLTVPVVLVSFGWAPPAPPFPLVFLTGAD